jgi:CheY-like chemotaxis protein
MEALGQLTGGIAHDFNNLLTVILGNSELLVDQPNDAELVASLSRQIMEAAERSSDLTQKLLAFGRRQSLKPQRLNVSGVVTSMVPLLRRTIGAHIELRTELHEGEHTALSDCTLLESAILNLVINARDAMAQGGILTLTTGERAAGLNEGALPIGQPVVFVTVSDTGEGMTSELLERVFEPFFTTKEVGKGSGLGLAMVYGFARQTGGHVSIQSTPGEGTAVTVVMPAITSSGQKTAYRDSPVMLSRTRERVLLVEDEPQVLQFASAQLLNLGYDVTAVATGQDALDLIQAGQPFDLLLTDVVLPKGMSGVELSRQAQSVQPNLKVLLTSGYSEEVFQHHGRPEEGTLLLRKPYRRKELAETLRKALEPTHTTDSARPT